jgi:intracellular sulfur oxidation DsrE/DsrF family protein
MQQSDHIDDILLGAFIDGQLDAANAEVVIAALQEDPDTRERLYRLRRAKDLMKVGFDHVEAPPQATPPAPRSPLSARGRFGIAASLLVLALGFCSGMLGYYGTKQLAGEASGAAIASAPQAYTDRIVLHLSESDPQQFAAALTYIENFLEGNQAEDSQIEVIANSGGLDLMRVDTSPFKNQLVAMMRDHDNVHFIACANAIRNLRKQGIQAQIIPEVHTDKTAIDHIIGRLQAGWRYVKIDNVPAI